MVTGDEVTPTVFGEDCETTATGMLPDPPFQVVRALMVEMVTIYCRSCWWK